MRDERDEEKEIKLKQGRGEREREIRYKNRKTWKKIERHRD